MQKIKSEISPEAAFYWLIFAAAYNILWGLWVIVLPEYSFSIHHLELPRYIEIWQCVGMVVGVYGLGYGIAASDPNKHWPIVLVGFLGKVFGPIGFIKALIDGVFPISFAINILFNDIIWWVPFFLILKRAYKYHQSSEKFKTVDFNKILNPNKKILLIALRHQGCTFTRKTLDQLSLYQEAIKNKNWSVVLVHMGHNDELKRISDKYLRMDYQMIPDPNQDIYHTLGFKKGSFSQLFGLQEFILAFQGLFKGYGLGPLAGDGRQLSGMAFIDNGKVMKKYSSSRASDDLPINTWLEST